MWVCVFTTIFSTVWCFVTWISWFRIDILIHIWWAYGL